MTPPWWLGERPAEAVLGNLATQGIAVHSQQIGSLAQIAIGLPEDVADELLFELAMRVFVAHASRHHFIDEALELLLESYDRAPPVTIAVITADRVR